MCARNNTGGGEEAQHPRHLRRRHRHHQHQRLQRRPDGLRRRPTSIASPRRASGSCTTTASSSCTAGRSAFLTGQHIIRTGLTKVGFPGAPMGMSQLDPIDRRPAAGTWATPPASSARTTSAIATRRCPRSTASTSSSATSTTSMPRKSRNCPTIRRTRRTGRSSARAACSRCKATDVDDPTVDPRFGKVGKQTIEDTGALTKKRMETIDDETSAAAIDYMKRQHAAGKPFFCWYNSHAHASAHARPRRASRPLQARRQRVHRRHDRARRDDRHAAQGARRPGHREQHDRRLHERQRPAHEHLAGRRDDAIPLGEEHELGRRVPRAVPGALAGPHQARHGHQRADEPQRLDSDALSPSRASPTSSASSEGLHDRRTARTYKVHLDGYDQSQVPDDGQWHGRQRPTARRAPATSSSTPTTTACSWPCGRATTSTSSPSSASRARWSVWAEPFTTLRLQKIFNLMQDPFERADITSNTFWDWQPQPRRLRCTA